MGRSIRLHQVKPHDGMSPIEMFAQRAERHPDLVAIEASGRAMTNRQLLDWAASISASMAERGVPGDARIVIFGPRGPAAVACMVAVLARGGVVVPVDWATPPERLSLLIRESEASLVVQIGDGQPIDSRAVPQLRIPGWPSAELPPDSLKIADHGPADPAYIFFTSGSTGKPKGILGSWGGLTQFMHWMADTFEIDQSDRVAVSRSLGFDAVMREIFVPLVTGARMVVAPDPMDPDDAIGWLVRQRITVTNATPSHAELWLDGVESATSSLRWVFLSGEIVTARMVLDWRERVSPPGELVNFYGPTETTFIRTFHVIGDVVADEPIPIGLPLPGTEVLLINEHNEEAESGEVVIRTDFGTLGYINFANDSGFVANPVTGDPDDLVYRTGDIGMRRADGALVVSGRNDLQMKILGVRIEPEEIESVLEQHDGVKRAVVVPVEQAGRITRLDAAILASGEPPPTTSSLRDHLSSKVPRVAVPARYVLVDEFPLNANGKVDRAELSSIVAESDRLTEDRHDSQGDRVAALSPAKRALLERRIAGPHAAQDSPEADTAGRIDRLSPAKRALLERRLKGRQEVPDKPEVDPASRIASLSPAKRALLEARTRGSVPDRSATKRAQLSSAQERLWVLDQMYPGNANYSIVKAHYLRGPLDLDVLRRSCEQIASRHEVLRTRYEAIDGDPVQVIDPPGPVQFSVVDLRSWSGDRQSEADRIVQEVAAYRYDLARDAIWRTTVVQMATDEHILISALHHIASDGWSLPILFSELSAAYNALGSGSAPQFDPLPIQYVDYSIRQRQAMDDGTYDRDLDFWKQQLDGVPDAIDLKTDRPRPDIMTFNGRNHRFVLSHTDSTRFQSLARAESSTAFMLGLAVFVSYLHERTGSRDVVVGVPSADRGSGDTQGLIGFLVNTLAIRHTLEPGSSFRDVLRSVRASLLASYDHRDVPFDQVVRAIAPVRHADRTPLFQVFFQYGVSAFTADPEFVGVAAELIEKDSTASKFDFTMYLGTEDASLAGSVVYNTDLFDHSTVLSLVDDFDRLTDRLVSNPDDPIRSEASNGFSQASSAPTAHRATSDPADAAVIARMCAIWGEVLGADVGPDDNFFELGGHSLTAIRAFSRVDAEFDVGLAISTIFEAPTPRLFAAEVERLQQSDSSVEPDESPLQQPDQRNPLSFAQRRLWFLHMLTPEAGNYHTPWRIRLQGDLSLPALQHAVDTIVERHPVFRTRIIEEGGVPFQVVDEARSTPIEVIEIPASSDLAAVLRQEAGAPFDLANEHPIRTKVFKLTDDDHIVSIVAHHIVTDADSMGIVNRELEALYGAHVEGRSVELPDVGMSYVEFASQQEERLTLDNPDLKWWLDTLNGATADLDVPTDRIRPPQTGGEAGIVRLEVDREVALEIERLARDEGMTPFMAYLTIYALLIHRFTRQDDFVIGIPSTERNRLDLENVVGFFVNSLPIRVRIEPGETARAMLKRIRAAVLEALAHRNVPFDAMIEHIDAPRDPSRTPAFQTMFDMRAVSTSPLSLANLSTVPVGVDLGGHPAKFDLRTFVTSREGNVSFLIEYRKDLFDEDSIVPMAEHFQELARAVVAETDSPIRSLGMAPLESVVEPRTIPGERLIDLVDRVFAQSEAATVVVDGEKSHTFGELASASRRVAESLAGAGIEPGDTVGVKMPRGADIVAAIVGILRAGATYVPLDLAYPQARIDTIAQDAGLKAIVSAGSDIGEPHIEMRSDGKDMTRPSSDRIAYIMYTSGSTGAPKGVEIEEQSIINLVTEPNYVDLDSDSVIGFASNTGFDAATFEIWGALLNGAQLHVLGSATLLAPEALISEIRTSGITVMFLTSALFNAVIRHTPTAFLSMDTLMVGGEALDPDAIRLCLDGGPPRRLVNGYGPTETTTFATWKLITEVPVAAKSIPIGTAISGASVAVVDEQLNEVPHGVPGELVIGGLGVAAGYRDNPAATADRFVHPDGGRVYRTGDLVRQRRNGDIEFLGRIDRQVKLRGFRIEPGEIEAHLRSHDAIEQAHVVVRTSENDSRLVAYVVGRVTSPEALDHLQPLVPGFMIPSAIVVLDALPLNANGKVDESALPSPMFTPQTFEPPHGTAQIAMARLWEEALEIDGIGADANFFDLGGHSLLAIRLMAAIEEEFGQRLPLSALFETPTLAALTDRISQDRPTPTGHVVTIKPGRRDTALVCMPPAGGNVMTYELMARSLDVDRAVLGIEAVGLDGTAAPLKTVEELAEHCLTEIKSAGISGPHVLVGYSLGGLIAFEVARRLRSEGAQVDLVVVIDARTRRTAPSNPAPGPERRRIGPGRGKRVARRARRLGGQLRHGPKTVAARLTGRALDRHLVERLMFRAAAKAASTYQPKPYDGRVLYILAGDANDASKVSAIDAWRDVTGPKLEVVGVPGTHRGEQSLMRAPHAVMVAAHIQAALTNGDRTGEQR